MRPVSSTAEIHAALARLDGETADALESETLDFKAWETEPKAHKSQMRQLCEDVVCFANQRGGVLVLGVADRKRTRDDAIQGVGKLDPQEVRRAVYRGTDPPITVDVEELEALGRRLLVVRVPRGLSPPHSTALGVAKIRVGKECRPLTGARLAQVLMVQGGVDLTAGEPDGATIDDLDAAQVTEVRKLLRSEDVGKAGLAGRSDVEILEALGLLHRGRPTLAAVLLVGTPAAIARFAPAHEVQFLRFKGATRYDARSDLRGPLLATIGAMQRLLEAHLRVQLVAGQGMLELTIPDITWSAAREALLNALMHRDWFVRGPIQVALHRDRVEVASPGGFLGDIRPDNILRHAPLRRNPLLADALQALGLVNRVGAGVDRMYEELLRLGKGIPRYEADELSVRLILPTASNEEFARFVQEETRAGVGLELDDLILLRLVTDVGQTDRWSAAKALQVPDEQAAAHKLANLRERGYLVPRGRGKGTSYRLDAKLSDRLRGRSATDMDLPFDAEAIALRVQAVLAERGRLTNAEIRRMTGHSRPAAIRLMQKLREEGLAEVAGRGRSAAWVPGPRLVKPRRKRRSSQ